MTVNESPLDRYAIDRRGTMQPHPDGDWTRVSVALMWKGAVAARDQRIRELEAERQALRDVISSVQEQINTVL